MYCWTLLSPLVSKITRKSICPLVKGSPASTWSESLTLSSEVIGITYSFSTTPETATAAIHSFREPLILIMGGSDKGSDYRDLGKAIGTASNVKAVILIGKMGPVIKTSLKNFPGLVVTGGTDMCQIVQQARKLAVSGDVVVLSPACASFDMFTNYKDRGKQFKLWVNQL